MINTVTLVGNLTKNAQEYRTSDDKVVAKFDIAINAGNDKVYYIPIVAFGTAADYVIKYQGKGSKVAVNGYLSQSVYTKKEDGTKHNKIEVVANSIVGMTANKKREATEEDKTSFNFDDADMPF